jgi:hypothetical protein
MMMNIRGLILDDPEHTVHLRTLEFSTALIRAQRLMKRPEARYGRVRKVTFTNCPPFMVDDWIICVNSQVSLAHHGHSAENLGE